MTKYQAHQAPKEQTRQHETIEQTKQCAIENPDSIMSIIFDLQKVLQAHK